MKITKYLLSMAAALGMFAGCYKPEMIQVSAPEDVVAPVLEAIQGPIDITAENMANGSVEFKWSLADYGVKTQVNYAIEVATAAAPTAVVTLTSGLTADTTALNTNLMTATVAYETLNQILFNDLKLGDGIAEDILFTVAAQVKALAERAGVAAPKTIDADFLLAERSRELMWEAHRRTDLIRFGKWIKGYNWTYKGGNFAGQDLPEHFNVFPVPSTELSTNLDLEQNPGYARP